MTQVILCRQPPWYCELNSGDQFRSGPDEAQGAIQDAQALSFVLSHRLHSVDDKKAEKGS